MTFQNRSTRLPEKTVASERVPWPVTGPPHGTQVCADRATLDVAVARIGRQHPSAQPTESRRRGAGRPEQSGEKARQVPEVDVT